MSTVEIFAVIPAPSQNSIGPIHFYSLLMVIAILLGRWLILYFAKKKNQVDVYKFIEKYDIAIILIAIIFARIYHLFTGYDWKVNGISGTFKIWEGGISIWGAFIGGVLTTYIFAKKEKLSTIKLLDFLVIGIVFGQAIARWGNYFNQELYGKSLSKAYPWALEVSGESKTFHPTFLYESIGCLLIGILLINLIKKEYVEGKYLAIYCILYGILRSINELLRIDHSTYFGPIRLNFFVSFGLILIGLVLLFKKNKLRLNN